MSRSRRPAKFLALFVLVGAAACQQVLGLDQPTVSIDAISRICECLPLRQQGPAFAGTSNSTCESALGQQPDEILLAVAENDCTDCDNVTPCYGLLTEAGAPGDACNSSVDCESWACCQGVLTVAVVVAPNGAFTPQLLSTPPQPSCCSGCRPCEEALDALNSDTSVVACADTIAPLSELLTCLGEEPEGCNCNPSEGVSQACLSCLINKEGAATRCADQFTACKADLARPVPVEP
jgi:hypothetical protein